MGEWRMRARDGGVENEGEGWGSGEQGRGMEGVENEGEGWREWRMRARDGGVENEGEGWGSGK